jgi:DnaJ-class molecular chaperone
MSDRDFVDFYEVLQVSASAEPETIHRVYRLLAQRWHPDNRETR